MPNERLSFDVLREFFMMACEAIDPQGALHTIIRLSSVCSAWRHTALAHPKLWSYIYLPMLSTAESSRPAEVQQSLLSLYIERSRDRPLFITIRNNRFARDLEHSVQLPFTRGIYALLRANVHRWHRLDIVGCHAHPQHMRLLLSLRCNGISSLKSLRLLPSVPYLAPNLLEWKNATALHTLHIYMYTVLPIQCSLLVKDLILEGYNGSKDMTSDIGDGLSYILQFFNIERLMIVPHEAIKTRGTIIVANLTSLTLCISIRSQRSFGSYLHELSLPRLHSFALQYTGVYLGNAIDHKPIVLFIHRGASSLQELIFDKVPLRPLGLAEILAPLRELRHLTVLEPTISLLRAYYPISEAFLLNFHDACFLPNLVTIDLQLHSKSTVERSMIDVIVKERTLRSFDANELISLRRRVIPQF